MLTSVLATSTIESIAIAAVADARDTHADAPDYSRAFLIADEAAHLAGQRMHEAALSAIGTDGLITPFGYWERAADPFVAAVLAQSTCAEG